MLLQICLSPHGHDVVAGLLCGEIEQERTDNRLSAPQTLFRADWLSLAVVSYVTDKPPAAGVKC